MGFVITFEVYELADLNINRRPANICQTHAFFR